MARTETDEGTVRAAPRIRGWQEAALLVGTAIVLALLIKTFFVQAFYIPSESMEPGFVKNDRILVQKVSYWGGGTPRRGDIIVFKDPGGWLDGSGGTTNPFTSALTRIGLYPAGGHLVKRVIGVAGDTITCCDAKGRVSVNGVPLDEGAYIAPQKRCNGPMTGDCRWSSGPVPKGSVFVMGDNRDHSADSTVHLCLPKQPGCEPGAEFVSTDLVVGKVSALFWPLSRFHLLHRPNSFSAVP
ncbi:MAG: lepB [Marmoricola sp.]|nr:lepB [Marmoricola sp.]